MPSTSALDLYVLYQFLKRLLNKYTDWDSYKTGVINTEGKIVVKDKDRSSAQKESFKMFDLVVLNIRHILDALPGGQNRLKNVVAAAWALHEGRTFVYARTLNEDALVESFVKYLEEDGMGAGAVGGPANNVGSGNVAGAAPGESPPVSKKRQKKFQDIEPAQIGRRVIPEAVEFVTEGNDFKKFKKLQVDLTPEERKTAMDAGAVWRFSGNGPSCAIWKTVDKEGKTLYHCNTHRCWQSRPTLKGALTAYKFVKTTA